MTDLAAEVRRRADYRCEYCRVPQVAFSRTFHIEHITARQHGGRTELGNLALACWQCNLRKGPNLTGIDPHAQQVVPLFHPRREEWPVHFAIGIETLMPLGIEVRGKTPTGGATAQVLGINQDMRQMLRYELWREGIYGRED